MVPPVLIQSGSGERVFVRRSEKEAKGSRIVSFEKFLSVVCLFLSPPQTGLSGVRKRRRKRRLFFFFFLLLPPLPNYLLGPSSFMLLL